MNLYELQKRPSEATYLRSCYSCTHTRNAMRIVVLGIHRHSAKLVSKVLYFCIEPHIFHEQKNTTSIGIISASFYVRSCCLFAKRANCGKERERSWLRARVFDRLLSKHGRCPGAYCNAGHATPPFKEELRTRPITVPFWAANPMSLFYEHC